MALYEGGKIRLNDEFIDQFKSEDVKEFLRIARHDLVASKRSRYCTVENMLYNWPTFELETKLYWYLMGKKNTTAKNCIKNGVSATAEAYELIKKLEEIDKQMCIENKWK